MPLRRPDAGLRPAVAVGNRPLHRVGGQHAAGPCHRGDAAGEVDRVAEPVAGPRERLAAGHAGAQLGERLALGVGGGDEAQRGGHQRLGLRADDHDRVADRLDEPHRRLDELEDQVLEASGDVAELVGRDLLAEPGEADEVGEGDVHVPGAGQRARLALLGADQLGLDELGEVQLQQVAQQRARAAASARRRRGRSARPARARRGRARARARRAMPRMTSDAWERPRPSRRPTVTSPSTGTPASRNCRVAHEHLEVGVGVGDLRVVGPRQALGADQLLDELLVQPAALEQVGPRVADVDVDGAAGEQEEQLAVDVRSA